MRIILRGIAVALALLVSNGSFAHHSGSMFDRTQAITLEGAVKEYQFTNPHVWIEVVVAGTEGKQTQWSIEGEGPSTMTRIGLGRKSLSPGDKISIRAHPLRDGRNGGSLIDIKLPSGDLVTSVSPD